ncbi:MAG: ABC transporter permease, partial [Dehalococcoidia bacterium]
MATRTLPGIRVAEQVSRREIPRRLPRNLQFWIGVSIVSTAVVLSILAPLLAPYDPLAQDIYARWTGPTSAHWLGQDEFGRDILSRILYGGRITLMTAMAAVVISVGFGSVIGAVAAYTRGWVDAVIMRILDVQMAYPGILLAIVFIVTLGPSQRSVIIALGIGGIPHFARLVRGWVYRELAMDYVLAARSIGQNPAAILFKHVRLNVFGQILVHASFAVSGAMVAEASLSFLGLGVDPSQPSWGRMLSNGTQIIYVAPHIAIVPIVVLSFV